MEVYELLHSLAIGMKLRNLNALWYATLYLVLNTVFYLLLFQVTYSPDISDNTYIDTLQWAVEKPGLIKCFANNSEGSSSETMSLFVTGNLFF
jgi:hypothetical protein